MKNQKMTNLERQHKRFDLFSKIALFAILGFTFVFGLFFVFANSDELKALFGFLMSLSTLSIFFVAPKIAKSARYICNSFAKKGIPLYEQDFLLKYITHIDTMDLSSISLMKSWTS